MTEKPNKRHTSLQPLSWHHHHALVLAQQLIREQETPVTLAEKVLAFWTHGGQEHFREEEELLLPTFAKHESVDRPEIRELLIEHIQIRSLVSEICDDKRFEKFFILGELLRAHIRKEEQIVFPMIESALTEGELEQLHFSTLNP